jgi:hypothetical protein
MSSIRAAALSAVAILSTGAAFGAPALPRYSIIELPAPAIPENCLPGLATRVMVTGLNDQGIASANFRCTSFYLPYPENRWSHENISYATSAHTGAIALTLPTEALFTTTVSLDSQRVYGQVSRTYGRGIAWSLAGGYEDAFQPYDCNPGRLDFANSGNENGYVVGWAFRPDPSAAPPLDTFCHTVAWVVRTPTGQFYGPVNGTPIDVNRGNVAVGTSGRSGIMMHLPSRREIVLNAGDATHAVIPSDINDRGEVVGYMEQVEEFLQPGCGPSNPVFWQRSGAQIDLPKLPGAASARPWSSFKDAVVVGESGSGDYCDPTALHDQRAAIWHGSRVTDLNALLPVGSGITLIYAGEINSSGQIVATGFRSADPLLICPEYYYDEPRGEFVYDDTLRCRDLQAYLLTPQP